MGWYHVVEFSVQKPVGHDKLRRPAAVLQSKAPTRGFFSCQNLKAGFWLVERARCVEQRIGSYSDGPQLAVRHRGGRCSGNDVLTKVNNYNSVNGVGSLFVRNREIESESIGLEQDGRSSQRRDLQGAAGRAWHRLLLRPGQPGGRLAAGLSL